MIPNVIIAVTRRNNSLIFFKVSLYLYPPFILKNPMNFSTNPGLPAELSAFFIRSAASLLADNAYAIRVTISINDAHANG